VKHPYQIGCPIPNFVSGAGEARTTYKTECKTGMHPIDISMAGKFRAVHQLDFFEYEGLRTDCRLIKPVVVLE
jgi:hypothetical protein